MITATNIEVEDWNITLGRFYVRYFHDDHPSYMNVDLGYLELFVLKQKLLGWWNMVFKNNEYVDDREGTWYFGDWIKERLNSEIVRDFIVSHINEND